MSGNLCLREIGRFLGIPYSEVNAVTSYITPTSKGDERAYRTIEDSWKNRGFAGFGKFHPEVLPLAKKLEGSVKTKGTHAAGIFVAPKPLYEYMPLEKAKKVVTGEGDEIGEEVQGLITAYSQEAGENLGLLKLDILASNTLTVIKAAEDMLDQKPAWDQINYEDVLTFHEFSEGHTLGVHQFDGGSITQLTSEAGVTCFEDLCALNALHRPGPLESGVVAEYVEIKQGLKDDKEIHPIYDRICKSTHGLIVYQEQVFRILREIGSFEWDDVNKVRKLVSKSKGQEAVNKYRKQFLEGAIYQGISSGIAGDIFNAIVKYGRYGFNKAHSALYSSLSFKCMYLKTHHPLEYMIALLTYTLKDKLFEYVSEANRLGILIRPPDVNRSEHEFTVVKGQIFAGLTKIKGVGAQVAGEIINKRPYENARDFLLKTRVSKETFLNLIRGGAFDGLYMSRRALFDQAEGLYDKTVGLTADHGSLDNFAEIKDNLEELIWDNSIEDWEPIVRFNYQLKVLELPSDRAVIDLSFLKRFPLKQLNEMKLIPTIKQTEPERAIVVGWLKLTAKMKKEVRACSLTDEFGNSIEVVAFQMAAILDHVKEHTAVVAHLKREESRGRNGYVLEKFELIIL
jgi:DNA polymerase-3 subunit alpha